MTETTIASAEPAASAPASAPTSEAYSQGDAGIREAAADLRLRREVEQERRAVSPEFIEEIQRALPDAAARQKARADEQEFAQGYERGAELAKKEKWTLKEATDVHVGKRELARQLAEEDLT